MKELVIISGKGGTGKTSIAASFAVLADGPVIATRRSFARMTARAAASA
jgi:septum formation inhibitor-activating ATPase MinD